MKKNHLKKLRPSSIDRDMAKCYNDGTKRKKKLCNLTIKERERQFR